MTGRMIGRVAFAVAALLLGAAAPAATTAAEARAWRHGILEAKSDAGIIMMPSRGGFAERQGLTLEIVQVKSDVLGLQALLAGELDSYEGGIGGSIKVASRGADVKIVGCYWVGLPHGIFVRSSIATVQDIEGKAFAISAPGALPDILARSLLDKYDIPAAKVRFVNLGSDLDRFKALAAGVVDAAVVSGEYAPIAASQGIRLLVPGRDVLPEYMRLCIHMTGKTIARRGDDAVRFLAAEIAGLRYALSHRDEVVALARQVTEAKPDDPRPAYMFDDVLASKAIDPELGLPLDKIAWMQDLLVRSGDLARPGEVTAMVDPSVRAKALTMLGP